MGWLWKTVTMILAFIAPLPTTNAHGYLADPASRNLLAHRQGTEYDQMSLNGGGPAAVWPDGFWKFGGGGNHYTCGRERYDTPGPIQKTWVSGEQVKIKLQITVAHRGHMYFGLCPANLPPTPDCFAERWLMNTDTGYRYWDLAGQPVGAYEMYFKLPDNFTCPQCTLWWWWVTGNSCLPPGDMGNLRACGEQGAVPEEFWNCADVSIVNGTDPSPPPPPPPRPRPPPPRLSPPSPRPKPPSPRPRPPSPRPPSPRPVPSPPEPTTCDGKDQLPFGTDQSPYYYICEVGRTIPTEMACPPGTLWNTDIRGCDWPKKVTLRRNVDVFLNANYE